MILFLMLGRPQTIVGTESLINETFF